MRTKLAGWQGGRRGVALALLILCCTACWPLAEESSSDLAALRPPTLRLSLPLPASLDPARVSDANGYTLVRAIYNGLFTYDAQLRPVPDLAAGLPSISDDGRSYTFTLRSNLTFADGKPLTVANVKYSLERACSPATSAPLPASSLPCASTLSGVLGMSEVIAGKQPTASGLLVSDDLHLSILLTANDAAFLAKLASPSNMVVEQAQVTSEPGWQGSPVGSGPFQVRGYDNNSLSLSRNPTYYGSAPSFDYIEVSKQPITDSVDLAALTAAQARALSGQERQQLQTSPDLSLTYLSLNPQLKPFDDPAVRQAFALAIDQASLSARVGLEPATSLLPPGKQVSGRFDLGTARRLLQASSYRGSDNLPPLTLYSSGDLLATSLAAQLSSNLGISVTTQTVEYSDFVKERSKYPAFIDHYQPAYADSLAFFAPLLDEGGAANYTSYRDEAISRQMTSLIGESDPGKRVASLRQFELDKPTLPIIPLAWGQQRLLVSPTLTNLSLTPFGLDLRAVSRK